MSKNNYPKTSIECKITFCKDCVNFLILKDKFYICPKAEKAIEQAIKRAIETESLFDLFKDDKKRNSYYARVAQLLFHMFCGCSNFENFDYISQQSKDLVEFAAINEVYKRITAKGGEQ